MLKLMRDSFHHLKWILLAIVAAFIFGFVFIDMGLGGRFGGRAQDDSYAARVNGDTITRIEYERALKNYEQMYQQMYGQQFTPEMAEQMGLPRQVLDSLIDQRLLENEAARLHLTATPEEVRKKLLTLPTFNPDGKFVGMELYTRYVTGALGYPSASAFEDDLAREIALSKMESALTNSVVISPKEAETEYKRMNENAKIRYVLVPSNVAAATVSVTPAEVEAYYKNNQPKYTHGEQRLVRYLLADSAKLRSQLTPSEQQIRQQYDSTRDQYQTPPSAHVLHILVKVDPAAPPAVDAAARAKAQSLVKQLRAGADFAALAKANSEDPSSASNGGDMGWVDKGQTVEPFERAIFSVPLNTISDPIRSQEYGYHIVKVVERREGGVRPYEEVRKEIAQKLAGDLARDRARAEVDRVAALLRQNPPKNVNQFTAVANDIVTSNSTGWFGRTDAIPGIGNHQPLVQWAFGAKPGDVGAPMGTPRGVVIPYLESVRPAGVSSFDEIRQKVEEDARAAKSREATRTQLEQMMAGAATVDQIAAKVGMPVKETTVSRQANVTGFTGDTSAMVEAALSANIGAVKGPIVLNDGVVVMQVVDQKKVSPAELAQSRDTYIDVLRSQQAKTLRSSLLQRLRKAAKIEVNEDIFRTPDQQANS